MSLILHASDLHFGKARRETIEAFLEEIGKQKPDLVILSGDFTQVGSAGEFRAARDFIARIPVPVFTVPGNHDIPRYHLLERFFDPMNRYRRHIAPMPDTVHEDDDCFIVGINTARPAVPHWNWANGMVSQNQVDFVHRQFRHAGVEKVRILVCHHPLARFDAAPIDTIVWGATDLLDILKSQHVDLVLTGHIHHASVLLSSEGQGPAMVGAASATSTRLRVQSNGYNLIHIHPDRIDVDLVHWDGASHQIFEKITLVRRSSS